MLSGASAIDSISAVDSVSAVGSLSAVDLICAVCTRAAVDGEPGGRVGVEAVLGEGEFHQDRGMPYAEGESGGDEPVVADVAAPGHEFAEFLGRTGVHGLAWQAAPEVIHAHPESVANAGAG